MEFYIKRNAKIRDNIKIIIDDCGVILAHLRLFSKV